jgi:hypothetical protein
VNNKKIKKWTRGEIRFAITNILVKRLDLKAADELSRLIYADVVASAIDEVNRAWEELNRAKDNDQLN